MNKNHFLASALCGGALALAFFASCTDKDLYDPVQAQAIREAKYEAQFKNKFGDVSADQDWGFGTASRATRGVNANANQWFTGEGGATPVYEVDLNVTDAERNAVFAYVNQDKGNLTVASQPNWTDYFVTQVWKGNKDELDGVKTPQTTSYPNQNGQTTTIDGASHMDQLEAQLADGTWEHINNFNNSSNGNTVNDADGNAIIEKMLMVNSGTAKFRYNNSQSSFQSEKYIIVKGSDIPNMPTECADYYYVCFDFENGYTDAEKKSENTTMYLHCAYTVDVPAFEGTKTITITNADHWGATEQWIAWNYTGKWNADTSDWKIDLTCTDGHIWNGTITYPEKSEAHSYSNNVNQNVVLGGFYDANSFSSIGDVVRAYENLPTDATITITSDSDNPEYKFVGYQNGDKHFDGDNVYTDWIVRISPAHVKENPVAACYRVFAEDLGADESDWDFNDVVFDVIQYTDGSTDIVLQAAGGTLYSELEFTGENNQTVTLDIHYEFGVEPTTMVNTRVNAVSRPTVTKHYNTLIEPRDVEIYITYSDGARSAIRSERGQAAGKFCIDCTNIEWVDWMDEYVDITTKYTDFNAWVQDPSHIWWN